MRKALISFLLIAACLLNLAACGGQPAAQSEPLTVNLLKVGKADAIILFCADQVMVIDTGEADDGRELCSFLRMQNVQKVDTLIITHFDRDHVGGAALLADTYPIGTVLLPAYEGSGEAYLAFPAALDRAEIAPRYLTEPLGFSFGGAEVLVEPPLSYEPLNSGEVDNNFSLITTVVHGQNRLVFTGDIEKQRIRQWLAAEEVPPCDFLKMPHHGVYNSALDERLDALSPSCAVICSSGKNPAEDKTLQLLARHGVSVLETRDGNVTVTSDGEQLEMYHS